MNVLYHNKIGMSKNSFEDVFNLKCNEDKGEMWKNLKDDKLVREWAV